MSEKVIKLPVGQLDAMGTKIIDEATITEFTAKVYKELGKRTNQQNAETVEDVILKNCVVAIGEKKNPSPLDLASLLAADRDYLILKIKQLSFGDETKGGFTCENCNEKSGISLSIEKDFNVWTLKPLESSDVHFPDVGLPVRFFTIKDEISKLTLKCRYDTGSDRAKASQFSKGNPVEFKMRLIASCILEIETPDVKLTGPVNLSYIENLPSRVWFNISTEWDKNQPGIDPIMKVECPHCGSENMWEIDPADFFSMAPQKTNRGEKLMKLSGS